MGQLRQMRNLALIGFMATGKSSVGRWLARRLDFDFIDTDSLIETRCKRLISEIFAQEGEARFREYEREVVRDLAGLSRSVISTGGGLAANEDSLARLKEHSLVVCLWAGEATIWRRASRNTHRPLLQDVDPRERIQTLLTLRTPFYKQADIMVNTDFRSIKQVAEHILREFLLVTRDRDSATPA
jgi:shikimate kinase